MDFYELIVPEGKEIPARDYEKLVGYLVPYAENMGGGIYRDTEMGRIFHLHFSHIRGAQILFKALNIEPVINVDHKIIKLSQVKPGEREKMPLSINIVENGIVVMDKNTRQEHFVPNSNLDILWAILKEAVVISPRHAWSLIALDTKMFPELMEIADIIKKLPSISEAKRSSYISALHSYVGSAFEGRRVRKKGTDSETLNYYSLWWYPILFFKEKGLVEQNGREFVSLTSKGKETENWKDVLKE